MNIILIGMRGSGKTTISSLLAEKLRYPCIEMDYLIEKKLGMKIAFFVKKNGWNAFRAIETDIVKELVTFNHTVISAGGGFILCEENVALLKPNGIFVYLTASCSTLYERIKNDPDRPFLTSAKTQKEDIEETLKMREKMYRNIAHFVISTETHTIEEIVQKIYAYLKEQKIV